MVISYLYSLGFTIIFSYNTATYCGREMNGCFLPVTKQIVVGLPAKNIERTFWHEVGHALTYGDKELTELCEKTGLVESYSKSHGDHAVYELMADLYVSYRLNPKYLSYKFPEIFEYFSNKDYSK